MRYEFVCENPKCSKTGEHFDHYLSMAVVSTPQEPPTFCPHCGKQAKRLISGGGGFILKGQSGWSGKVSKTKRDRQRRSEELETRQYERHGLDGGASMVPNYKGQIFDKWRDVKKAAESDAHAGGKPLDPMHEHMERREQLLEQVTTRTQVTKAAGVSVPTKVVGKAKKASNAVG